MRLFYIISIVCLFFSCNKVTERNNDFDVHGIDVSHYQSIIDWKQIKAQDITFAFVKATEGMSMLDTNFCQNWSDMKEMEISRGAYHFFRPTISSYKQALNFIKNVQIIPGDLPPVLDVEVVDGVHRNALIPRIKTWLEIIEKEYRVKPIIYTNQKFFNKYLSEDFKDYPLWIARYSKQKPQIKTGHWSFWQYGNRGQLKGINGFVDLNVFNGSQKEFEDVLIPLAPAYSSNN